jgi:Domain of unknown function (DUF4062)
MTPPKKLQIFVSSTYQDLKSDRQAAVEAILKAGHIPAGMELFSAGNESQLETIRRWIDDSDVYMLILGGRYGSVDPKTSLSYTELEYDYAISKNKPIFAVVITEVALDAKVKTDGRGVLETENPKELKFFREKVLSKISSFFSDPKDIKLAVHETLADYSKRLDFTGWVSGKEIVDTRPLLEELSQLRDEKARLQAELSKLKDTTTKSEPRLTKKWSDHELGEVVVILDSIEVTTKAFSKDVTQPPSSHSVFALLSACRDRLITGVTNSQNSNSIEIFLYYNVCPKLEIYELAVLENVSGMQWQRYRLTQKGKALLVLLDKQKARPATTSTPMQDSGSANPASTPPLAVIPRRRRSVVPTKTN